MSVSFTAVVFWGVKINRDDVENRKKNPNFDSKNPFDSKTGQRAPEYLDDHFDADKIAKALGLEVQYTAGDDIYFGKALSKEIDLNYDEGGERVKALSDAELIKKTEQIQKLFGKLELSYQAPETYLVTYVG